MIIDGDIMTSPTLVRGGGVGLGLGAVNRGGGGAIGVHICQREAGGQGQDTQELGQEIRRSGGVR